MTRNASMGADLVVHELKQPCVMWFCIVFLNICDAIHHWTSELQAAPRILVVVCAATQRRRATKDERPSTLEKSGAKARRQRVAARLHVGCDGQWAPKPARLDIVFERPHPALVLCHGVGPDCLPRHDKARVRGGRPQRASSLILRSVNLEGSP